MLLAAARVLRRAIGDEPFTAEEPAGTFVETERGEEGVCFEDEQTPLLAGWGQPRRGRFVVFEHDGGVGYSVRFGGEEPARGVVGVLFRCWWGGRRGFEEGGGMGTGTRVGARREV